MIRQVAAVAAIAIALGSSNAIAQVEQQYVEVGEGASGMPVYLDKASIRGTSFKIIQQVGDGISVNEITAYCSQQSLISERIRIFDSNGELLAEDNKPQSRAFVSGAPATIASTIVCQSAISGSSQQP